jgi:hypothetical protein
VWQSGPACSEPSQCQSPAAAAAAAADG